MKTGITPLQGIMRLNSLILVGVFVIVAAAVAVPVYSERSNSLAAGHSANASIPIRENATVNSSESLALLNFAPRFSTFQPLSPVPPFSSVTVATFAADCTTPQTLFHPGDTVCAQVTGATPGWQLIWSDPDSFNSVVQTDTITSDPQNISLTLLSTALRGDWRATVYDPFGGNVYAVTTFTVSDPQNPLVDVQVSKSQSSSSTSAGAQVVFSVQVMNGGPDDAKSVQLTDAVPANTTFVSLGQLSGPVFSCTNPAAGATGTTVCTIPTLHKGDVSTFLATYQVNGGVSAGTTIDNTASISNSVPDSNSANDSSTASVPVMSSPCVLSCPSDITQNVDDPNNPQNGAVVNYSNPGHTGDCGQDSVDPETGNTIPAISCSPASGSSFFPGTTTVICSSQTGAECTFQVNIVNPGNGLTITLNGANPFTLECGTDFVDPGATASDNSNPNVPVTVSGTVNSHQPGSYTLTYSATDGGNSVSTTRTVNVGDTAAPVITLNGANPMNVSCGDTFTDPGASANDACEGAEPVTSDASSVNPNVPGTYTITYTASDHASPQHTTTATRTVNVQPSTPSTTTPADQTVCQGATATFSTTTSGNQTFHYAWTVDGSAAGTDSPTLTVDTTNLSAGNHTVSVTVSSACGSTTKNATLTVQAPTATTKPNDQTVCPTGTATFSTTASGTGPFSFTWRQGATVLNNGDLGGRVTITSTSTTSTLTISNVLPTDAGTYSVDTSGTCGTATQSATLTVDASPPVITTNGQTPVLWPPNHSYHTFTPADFISSVSDSCDTLTVNDVYIIFVTSDEADNGPSSGNTVNDIVIASDCKSVQLRAEREGGGDGRVYTIYFKVRDRLGRFATASAKVIVPVSSPHGSAVDSGPHNIVTSGCP